MSIPYYTFNFFDPSISKELGSVITTHVEAVSLGRAVVADIKGIFGGKAGTMDKKIQDSIKGAHNKFIDEAKNKYSNVSSIIDYNVQVTEFGNGAFICSVITGTAIGPREKQRGGKKNKTYKFKR
jgi:uncharacterized protein YbjQ (UPF0145 family)